MFGVLRQMVVQTLSKGTTLNLVRPQMATVLQGTRTQLEVQQVSGYKVGTITIPKLH